MLCFLPGVVQGRPDLSGQRPGLHLQYQKGNGWCHAHAWGWDGRCGSGHPLRTLQLRCLCQEETSHSCASICSSAGNSAARSSCEKKKTPCTLDPLCACAVWGAGWGWLQSLKIVTWVYLDILWFYTCWWLCLILTLSSLSLNSRLAQVSYIVRCGWRLKQEETIYLMVKHLYNPQIYCQIKTQTNLRTGWRSSFFVAFVEVIHSIDVGKPRERAKCLTEASLRGRSYETDSVNTWRRQVFTVLQFTDKQNQQLTFCASRSNRESEFTLLNVVWCRFKHCQQCFLTAVSLYVLGLACCTFVFSKKFPTAHWFLGDDSK